MCVDICHHLNSWYIYIYLYSWYIPTYISHLGNILEHRGNNVFWRKSVRLHSSLGEARTGEMFRRKPSSFVCSWYVEIHHLYRCVCVCVFYVCINFNIEPRNCWCCYIYIYIYHPNFDPALVWHRHGSRLVIRGLYPSPNRYILQILSNLPSSKLTWQLLKMKILNMLVDQRVK